MTGPADFELLALATAYALDAVDATERADIEHRLAVAPDAVAGAFRDEVRAIHETMAVLASGTAAEPPASLRNQILAAAAAPAAPLVSRPKIWRTAALAAAAAAVIGLGALSAALALRPAPTPPPAAQVFAAADVHTASAAIPTGGTATLVYSRDTNAGVLVMNNVAPPPTGSVYQMWLLDGTAPKSAGTMSAGSVKPSTTAVLSDLGNSSAVAFTVEPGAGSTQPTGTVFAELQLS